LLPHASPDHDEVKGDKITFFTGSQAGCGEKRHTRWEGVISGKEIKGSCYFDDGIRGESR